MTHHDINDSECQTSSANGFWIIAMFIVALALLGYGIIKP